MVKFLPYVVLDEHVFVPFEPGITVARRGMLPPVARTLVRKSMQFKEDLVRTKTTREPYRNAEKSLKIHAKGVIAKDNRTNLQLRVSGTFQRYPFTAFVALSFLNTGPLVLGGRTPHDMVFNRRRKW